jgi:hypothetical protein
MTDQQRQRRLHIFMFSVRKTDHCWFWKGSTRADGYGAARVRGMSQLAHRCAWLLMRGPIPKGLVVRHRCDNRRCVNPNHLQLGTVLQNVRDAWERDRYPGRGGLANGRAKLTPEKVLEIRADTTSTDAALAELHGVSDVAIRYARSGKTWAHV